MTTPPLTQAQGDKLNRLHHSHVVAAMAEATYENDMVHIRRDDSWLGTPEHQVYVAARRKAQDAFYQYVHELTGGTTGP